MSRGTKVERRQGVAKKGTSEIEELVLEVNDPNQAQDVDTLHMISFRVLFKRLLSALGPLAFLLGLQLFVYIGLLAKDWA